MSGGNCGLRKRWCLSMRGSGAAGGRTDRNQAPDKSAAEISAGDRQKPGIKTPAGRHRTDDGEGGRQQKKCCDEARRLVRIGGAAETGIAPCPDILIRTGGCVSCIGSASTQREAEVVTRHVMPLLQPILDYNHRSEVEYDCGYQVPDGRPLFASPPRTQEETASCAATLRPALLRDFPVLSQHRDIWQSAS